MSQLLSVSIFPVVLTLAAYQIGAAVQKRFRMAICNPILIAVVLVILFLSLLGIPVQTYQVGTSLISWLMTPATICLAIPMYEQYQILKKSIKAILAGVFAGSVASLLMTLGLCVLFGFSDSLTVSLLPKSITSAIGVPLAELSGGLPSVCTAAIIFTGILGNIFGKSFCKLFHISDPIAQGAAFGTASHVIGTTKANELDLLIGAVSSLSLVCAGLITAIILPIFSSF